MKNKIFILLLQALVMLCGTVRAEATYVTIGSSTGSSSNGLPYGQYAKYSTSHMLYQAYEIGKAGRITSIAFQVNSIKELSTANVTIYLGITSNSSLTTQVEHVSPKNIMQVYSGSPTLGTIQGWEQIDLDTPYEYDGKSNLVVIICKTSTSTSYSNLSYNYTSSTSSCCLDRAGYNSTYSDLSDISGYQTSSNRPNIRLGMEPSRYEEKSFELDGIKYQTTSAYRVKVLDNAYTDDVTIPSSLQYDGSTYWVDEITAGVLSNCTSVSLPVNYDFGRNSTLKKLYIEEGPTTFTGFSSCTALEDVSLPGSLTSIQSTFTNCTSLKTVAFRYGTTKLKGLKECDSYSGTFRNCKLDSIFVDREFDFSFTSTYSSPFSWNGTEHTLRVIRIGDNLKTVQANMFYNSNELKRVVLGNSLVSIEDKAFGDCEKLEGDLILPSTVKTIGKNAFSYGWYYGEGQLVLNEGLTSIGENAFANCNKLKVDNFPSTVTSIGESAFNSTKFAKLVIPSEVTSIGSYAFGKVSDKLIIEDGTSTLTLESSAFSEIKIKNLYLGRKIVHNESYRSPFENSYGDPCLQEVIIGDYVTSIPAKTFYGCSNLSSITIGSRVSTIGESAFLGVGLNAITIKAVKAPTIADQTSFPSDIPVYVPSGSKASYLAANYWKNNVIIDPSDELITVNLTMPGTLEGRLRIQKVEAANVNKLKITGEMNDDDWTILKNTNMPNLYYLDLSEITNTSIPQKQFQSHAKLVNVQLSNALETVGDYAFDGCKALSGDFTFSVALSSIGNYAFQNTRVGNVHFNGNVTIGNYAFKSSKLKSISLNKCTSIGTYAFASCTNLSGNYQLSADLVTLPDYAFSNCSSLEGVTLPYNLKSIGNSAFANCTKITEIELHNPLTSLGSTTSSFVGCSGITSIKTHWTKPISVLSNTFSNVDKTKCTLYVPKKSTDWYLITTGWDEFVNVVEYDDTEKDIVGLNLVDGETYSNDREQRIGSLTFSKTFSASTAGNWNALYVPMSINVEEYEGELDFAKIYAFCATTDTNGDGVVDAEDENFLFVKPVTAGSTKPNTPYLVRPKEAKTYVINSADNVLYPRTEGKVTFSTTEDAYTVTGLNEAFTVTAGDNNYYMSTTGRLNIRTSGSTNVKANRWIMHRESKNEYNVGGSQEANVRAYRVLTIGEDIDESTAIAMIKSDTSANADIYTLDGRKVLNTGNLLPGIYIRQGKKFIIK